MPAQHPAPLRLHRDCVRQEWIDANEHMNVAYYVLAFDYATDAFFSYMGLGDAHREATNCATFAVECHVTYTREVRVDDSLAFATQLLAWDEKRIHFIHQMYHADQGYLAASSEWLSLHVDLGSRRVTPMPDSVVETLRAIEVTHRKLPRPPEAGHVIAVP